jgi:hypothetical protein
MSKLFLPDWVPEHQSDQNDEHFLDFNDPPWAFHSLGKKGGLAVYDSAVRLAHNAGIKDDKEAASERTAALPAMIEAVRLALPRLCERANLPDQVRTALGAIAEELSHAERHIRLTTASPGKRGTKPTPNSDLEFYGRAVIAVRWLQRLKQSPLSASAARAIVAKEIPARMLGPRRKNAKKYTPLEKLAEWEDAFGRTGAKGGKQRVREMVLQDILRNLRFEIYETWERSWRDPVTNAAGQPVLNDRGEIAYGEEQQRDHTHATRKDVLGWLQKGLARVAK